MIVARRRTSLFALPLVRGIAEYVEEGALRMCERRPAGWQVLSVEDGGLPEADGRDWLRAMVEATRRPVMIASVSPERSCVVRGLGAGSGQAWSVRLPAEPRTGEAEPHFFGAEAVEAVVAWSTAAGLEPDRDRIGAVLAGKPDYFMESVFFRLLGAAGLGDPVAEAKAEADREDHTLADGWLDPAKLEASITAMKPGVRRALECVEHEACYVKVLMRPGGDYEIEYRDGAPAEPLVTVTPSLADVVAALLEWSASEVAWREDFAWSPR
ncbi:hypothetical protein [Catenulispora yoronensis]|uniref:hypothetical protein n=1 Tax=Catenulispora yoronensis TaxID=450799 RepID=UPI0031DD2628